MSREERLEHPPSGRVLSAQHELAAFESIAPQVNDAGQHRIAAHLGARDLSAHDAPHTPILVRPAVLEGVEGTEPDFLAGDGVGGLPGERLCVQGVG